MCGSHEPCEDPCKDGGSHLVRDPTAKHRVYLSATSHCGALSFRGQRVPGRPLLGASLPHGARFPALLEPCGELFSHSWAMTLVDKTHGQDGDNTGDRWHAHLLANGSTLSPSVRVAAAGVAGENANLACLAAAGFAGIAAFGGHRTIRRAVVGACRGEQHIWSPLHMATTSGDAPAACMARHWALSEPVLDGSSNASHCSEARRAFRDVGCEFDGKLSVVAYRGQLLLFARANLHDPGGARHVQVARSQDGGRSFSRFRLLEIDGVDGRDASSNIYYFNVQRRAGGAARDAANDAAGLVALFPAVFGRKCASPASAGEQGCMRGGVYMSRSTDAEGVHWSAPELLLPSPVLRSRSPDHPVGIVEADGATAVCKLRPAETS